MNGVFKNENVRAILDAHPTLRGSGIARYSWNEQRAEPHVNMYMQTAE